jgi:hypothetical protein
MRTTDLNVPPEVKKQKTKEKKNYFFVDIWKLEIY